MLTFNYNILNVNSYHHVLRHPLHPHSHPPLPLQTLPGHHHLVPYFQHHRELDLHQTILSPSVLCQLLIDSHNLISTIQKMDRRHQQFYKGQKQPTTFLFAVVIPYTSEKAERGNLETELIFSFGPGQKTPSNFNEMLKLDAFKKEFLRFLVKEFENPENGPIVQWTMNVRSSMPLKIF